MPQCAYCKSTIVFGGVCDGAHWFCNRRCQKKAALRTRAQLPSDDSTTSGKSIQWYSILFRIVSRLLDRDSLAEIAVLLTCTFLVSWCALACACGACEALFPQFKDIAIIAILIGFVSVWIRVCYLVAKIGKNRTFSLSRVPIFGLCAMFFLGGAPAMVGDKGQMAAIWGVIALSAAGLFTVSYLVLTLLLSRKLHISVWLGSLALIAGSVKIIYDIASRQ